MLPEVKAYFDAIDSRTEHIETDRVFRAHPVPAWDHTMSPDQVAAYFEAEDKRKAALRELDKTRKEKQAEAYQKLVASEDPLVRFLVTDPEVQRYPQHAEAALKTVRHPALERRRARRTPRQYPHPGRSHPQRARRQQRLCLPYSRSGEPTHPHERA